MPSYRVVIAASAEAEFRAVPFPMRRQLNVRIMRLKSAPRPSDSESLSESEQRRLSVYGRHVLYEVDDARELVTVWAFLKA